MRPLALRGLTPGERALAQEMFGDGLDSAIVRILAVPLWARAFVAGPRLMVWPVGSARSDFAASATPLATQGVFVHELTHVWQAQNGVRLLWAKLKAGDRPEAYAYDLDGGAGFPDLNIEQQAMVVEHAFLASRGAEVPHPPERYAEVKSAWQG
jgi:hypothetical protein